MTLEASGFSRNTPSGRFKALSRLHSKNKVVTFINSNTCHFGCSFSRASHFDMVCLFALCVLAHYAPLGEVP